MHGDADRFNMAAMQDPPVVHEPHGRPPDAAVVWLHGLGADGHDFAPIVPELGAVCGWTRFVFPHAPIRPVSINFGMAMRSWYDIRDEDGRLVSDEGDLRESQRRAEALLAEQAGAGIAPERIVLAGFSQGGAVALQTALRHPHRLAGVMALSTYLPLADTLAEERSAANAGVPIFMAHGEEDPLIGVGRAESSRDTLRRHGYEVEWCTYAMAHAVCPEEVRDVGDYLARVLPAPAPETLPGG